MSALATLDRTATVRHFMFTLSDKAPDVKISTVIVRPTEVKISFRRDGDDGPWETNVFVSGHRKPTPHTREDQTGWSIIYADHGETFSPIPDWLNEIVWEVRP